MTRRIYRRFGGLFRRLRPADGFGLIELTIAMTILAIALVATSAVFVAGNVVYRRAGQQDAATTLADRMMERYRAITWSDIALSSELLQSPAGPAAGYLSGPGSPLGGSLSNDITEANGALTATSCTGTDQNALPLTCIPSRSIPDTSASHPEVAPDYKSYRIDSYVTWGCPDGSAPDPSTGCGGSLFTRVKVVTIVIRDATNLSGPPVYEESSAFDRLGGGSMPAVTVTPTGTASTSTGATTTTPGGAPNPPSSVTLANGGGQGSAYVNANNAGHVNIDVVLPGTSSPSDLVFLKVDDGLVANGGGGHVYTAQGNGTNGAGTVHFTSIDLSGFNDGTITISVYVQNSYGASSTVSSPVTKDTVPPTVAISTPVGGWTGVSPTGTFTGTAGSDPGDSSVTLYFCKGASTCSTSSVSATGTVSGGSWSAPVSLHKNWSYAVQAFQQDVAGNTGQSSPVTFTTSN